MTEKNQMTDQMVVLIANLFNMGMVAIFLCRKSGLERLEYVLGLALILLVFPLVVAVHLNFKFRRPVIFILLPLPLILYLLTELFFEYIFRLPFRETVWLWPYLGLYYLGLFGMIGYAFSVRKSDGYLTLFTYFLNLLATWYAHMG